MTRLAPEQGALRARLAEDETRRLLESPRSAQADDRADDQADDRADDSLGEAVRLALGGGVVAVEVATWAADRAVRGRIGATPDAAAGAARAGAVRDGSVTMAPGVEMSAFPVDRVAVEVLRLFPPDPSTPSTPSAGAGAGAGVGTARRDLSFTLPAAAGLMMSRALREQDETLARATAELAGLDEVPALLESLSASLRGDATVTVAVGDTVLPSRRWLQCHLGWVAVAVTPGGITHRLVDRSGILDTVVRDLVAAWEIALASGNGAA